MNNLKTDLKVEESDKSSEIESSSSDASSYEVENRYKGIFQKKREIRKIKAELKGNPNCLRKKYKDKSDAKIKKEYKYSNCLIKDSLDSNLFGTNNLHLINILIIIQMII